MEKKIKKTKNLKRNKKVMLAPHGIGAIILKKEKIKTSYKTIQSALDGYCYTYEDYMIRKIAKENGAIYLDDIE